MTKSKVQLGGVKNKVRRALCAHRNIVYGPMRDICIDCLEILDEHPEGRKS